MSYINLLNSSLDIYPIFGRDSIKNPCFLSMDDSSIFMQSLTDEQIKNQESFNEFVFDYGNNLESDLIISGFLENRRIMFSSLGFSQMIEQERFFHLGLDLSVAKGLSIYVPIDAIVYESGYEEGAGNYGGYIVLQHCINGFVFYTLYGHQNRETLPEVGTSLKAGDKLSVIGDFDSNGGYFHHLHLQIITQEGIDNGYISKGYIREDEIKDINKYVLDPNYIFRY